MSGSIQVSRVVLDQSQTIKITDLMELMEKDR